MSSLSNKRIILGVTGGIAAYKSAEIVARLQDQWCRGARCYDRRGEEFIRPLTMQALSGILSIPSLLDSEAEAGMGHIELARWADLLLIAPASADFIANMVHGRADSLAQRNPSGNPGHSGSCSGNEPGHVGTSASVANISMLASSGVSALLVQMRAFRPAVMWVPAECNSQMLLAA